MTGTDVDIIDRVARLSPRHKECLRLAYHRRVTKEIAAELGLADGTVKTYCTEAIRILDARDRRDAAEILHAWEDAQGGTAASPHTPSRVELPTGGGASTPLPPPAVHPVAPSWVRLLPFRHKDAPGNDLPVLARFFWIILIAALILVAFGAGASGLHVLSDIVRAAGSRR